jgi:hypothetical protein
VTWLLLSSLEKHLSPQADPVNAVQLSRLYLSPLKPVFDVCVCERRACRTTSGVLGHDAVFAHQCLVDYNFDPLPV